MVVGALDRIQGVHHGQKSWGSEGFKWAGQSIFVVPVGRSVDQG